MGVLMLTTIAGILSLITALLNIVAILTWVAYIIVVSIAVKYLYTDKYPTTAKPITSAVIGTVIGATFNYGAGLTSSMFSALGVLLAIVGTIVYIRIYNRRENAR